MTVKWCILLGLLTSCTAVGALRDASKRFFASWASGVAAVDMAGHPTAPCLELSMETLTLLIHPFLLLLLSLRLWDSQLISGRPATVTTMPHVAGILRKSWRNGSHFPSNQGIVYEQSVITNSIFQGLAVDSQERIHGNPKQHDSTRQWKLGERQSTIIII